MTTTHILLMIGFYLVLFAVVAYFTRAKARRILGALAGGAAFGFVGLAAIAMGEARGWWEVPVAADHCYMDAGLQQIAPRRPAPAVAGENPPIAALVLNERQFSHAGPCEWLFYSLLWLGFTITSGPTYLVLWRVVRRFGGRGLAVCVLISTVIGPPRDYWIASMFPAWMTFAPGVAPVIADAVVYALLIIVGHVVMRAVVGPAQGDALARGVPHV